MDLEARVPRNHPLRAIRALTNATLAEMLEDSGLPEPVRELGGVLLGQIAHLDAKIGGLEKELRACARQGEQAARLMTIPGIGPIGVSMAEQKGTTSAV